MRRAVVELADHTDNLGKLVHQLAAILQPAGGIDDQHVRALRARLFHRLIGQRGRIATLVAGHNLGAGALAPDKKLLDGGGTERVTGGQHHALALLAPLLCQLARGRRLARSVDADQKHDMWAPCRIDVQRRRDWVQNFGNAVGKRGREGRCSHFTIELVAAHAFGKTCRHPGSEVGRDQRVLDLLNRGRVDGRTPRKRGQRRRHLGTCLAEAGCQFLQPAHARSPLTLSSATTVRTASS